MKIPSEIVALHLTNLIIYAETCFFQVHCKEMKNNLSDIHVNTTEVPIKLRTFVELTMDIASASPRRYFFEARISMFLTCHFVLVNF